MFPALVGGFFTTSAPWEVLFDLQTFGNYLPPLAPDPSHHICIHSYKASREICNLPPRSILEAPPTP